MANEYETETERRERNLLETATEYDELAERALVTNQHDRRFYLRAAVRHRELAAQVRRSER